MESRRGCHDESLGSWRILWTIASRAPQPPSPEHLSLAALTVREAQIDLLKVDPVDLGPGSPATAALEFERGPAFDDPDARGE
jgi:hypothetical protein